jgi:hypothetical protein
LKGVGKNIIDYLPTSQSDVKEQGGVRIHDEAISSRLLRVEHIMKGQNSVKKGEGRGGEGRRGGLLHHGKVSSQGTPHQTT